MTRSAPGNPAIRTETLAFLVSWVSITLLVIYTLSVLTALFPLELLTPTWQLRLIGVLVDNGPLALLGFLLLLLAAWLEPSQPRLLRWATRLQSWALLAVLGFLLLLPLQGVAIWQGLANAGSRAAAARQDSQRSITSLRQAVLSATSTADLQARLARLKGLPLDPARLNEPLPQLRLRLLTAIQLLEGRLRSQPTGPPAAQLMQLLKESVRSLVASLALAVGFAAGAKRPMASRSLLAGLGPGLQAQQLRWRRWRDRSRREQELRERTRRADAAADRARREQQAASRRSLFEDDRD